MRYSVLAPGKRLRPSSSSPAPRRSAAAPSACSTTACALELIHTYSLIHDDLPAMDDDDYRRGRLTNHKVFGEAMAILAGDALLTLAFRAGRPQNAAPVRRRAIVGAVVTEVADAAGTDGMVGGQVVDIESEGKTDLAGDARLHPPAQDGRAHPGLAARRARLLAGGRAEQVEAISQAGQALGLAFQIVDDILDVEGSLAELGKTAGSDERKQKATYPSLHGLPTPRSSGRAS